MPELIEHAQHFSDILRSDDGLRSTDLQLCCALVAFCLQLRRHLSFNSGESAWTTENPEFNDDIAPLDEIAKTFIYQKLDGISNSDEQRITLTWSALVLGSFLLQQPDGRLRTKGHIIHMNLSLHLGLDIATCSPSYDNDSNRWTTIESLLGGSESMGSLWHGELVEQWRRDWQGSLKRQRRWEKQGVWMIGAPKRLRRLGASSSRGENARVKRRDSVRSATVSEVAMERYGDVDIIEYLVLREARDSLPRVE